MAALTATLSPTVKLRQDFTGYAFILMYAFTFTCQFLSYIGVIGPSGYWYMMVSGAINILAFAFLWSLSNNISCQIFSATLILTEIFFSFVLPFVIMRPWEVGDHYITYMSVSICLCVLGVYVWLVLLTNNPFPQKSFRWLVFLPAPYVLGIFSYWCTIMVYAGQPSLLVSIGLSTNIIMLISWFFIPVLCIGFWRLCHSQCFSRGQMPVPPGSGYVSVKIFMFIYTTIILAIFLLV